MNKNVVILNFSPRIDGNCGKISDFLFDFHNRTNVSAYHIDFTPCRGCNYECLTPGAVCPLVDQQQKEVMQAACDADLVYFIVPNFCGYPCTNYFAFNERKVGFFNGDRALTQKYMSIEKKFIVVSNTEGDNFRNALQQQTSAEPEILYLKTGKYKKRSTAGDILDSQEAVADLTAFLEK